MTAFTVHLHVTIDHEPGHQLAPEDVVVMAVEDGFASLGVPAEITIDDVSLGVR